MTQSAITTTLKKVQEQPSEYSLGFKRIASLPARVRSNINLACVLKGESNDNSMKALLNEMTEREFINFLKLA